MSVVQISSSGQFSSVLSKSTIVIADFYADWCGPCKTIAPMYASLATKHSSSSVTFTKINVDSQPDISRQYSVTAMPTFLIFKSGAVINTLRGADPRGLTSAIENAVKLAGAAKPQLYASKGHTLGGAPSTGRGVGLRRPVSWTLNGVFMAIYHFLGLYFISLFSLDPYISAERSPFNIHAEPPRAAPSKKAPTVRKVGTLADLGST